MIVAAAVGGGVLYALAHPPFDLAALGWVCLVPLLLALRDLRPAAAFRLGVAAGYVSGWCTQWWLADSVRQYFALSSWTAAAYIGAGHLLVWGLPFGLFAAAAVMLRRRASPMAVPFVVAAAWVATELLRARVIGQPWALLGYSQHGNLPLIQVAAVSGVYGVSFTLALVSSALAEAVMALRRGAPGRSAALLGWVMVPACAWLAGSWAIAGAVPDGPRHEVIVVQSNLHPARHWTRAYGERQLRTQLRLTETLPPASEPALIVWPENAVSRYPEHDPLVAARLAGVARRHGADLLFGAPRSEAGRVYNSARLVRAARPEWVHYDKRRLVPFAEESPFRATSAAPASASPEAFSRGAGSGAVDGFVRLGVSICHEILHPDLVAASVRDGARLLVNIANDGLLDRGYGIAASQHAAMAVFRAVETQRFLVRAATTGESLVIDPLGRTVGRLPLGVAGTLRASVTEESRMTPYARFGDVFAAACAALGAAALLVALVSHRPRTTVSDPLLP